MKRDRRDDRVFGQYWLQCLHQPRSRGRGDFSTICIFKFPNELLCAVSIKKGCACGFPFSWRMETIVAELFMA